jgi:Flp pilus assembly protein TadD
MSSSPTTRSSRSPARPIQRVALLLLVVMGASCRADDGGDGTQVARIPPTPPTDRGAIRVDLEPALAAADISRAAEMSGLATGLFEMGLNDLPHVVASVGAVGVSPGLAHAVETRSEQWTARLALRSAGAALTVEVVLCDGAGLCRAQTAQAQRESLQVAVAELLGWTAAELRIAVLDDVRAGWAQSPSGDAYAVLVAGRAAAVLYGAYPPASDITLGDRRRDPVNRAVHIDPHMGLSAWVLSRRDLARGEPGLARVALSQAFESRPWSAVLQADDAALADMLGRGEASLEAWKLVVERAPADLRFTLPYATAASLAGRLDLATDALDGLPRWAQDDVVVVALRVSVADLAETRGASDALLLRWQRAASTSPEPVRRRIALRVADRDFESARTLVQELSSRGAADEAVRVDLALAMGVNDLDGAVALAEQAGLPALAARVRARKDGAASAPPLEGPLAAVVQADARRAAGDANAALDQVNAVLALDPWLPEALAVQAACLDELSRTREADAARERLRSADPDWPGA